MHIGGSALRNRTIDKGIHDVWYREVRRVPSVVDVENIKAIVVYLYLLAYIVSVLLKYFSDILGTAAPLYHIIEVTLTEWEKCGWFSTN